jgi:PhnB protein
MATNYPDVIPMIAYEDGPKAMDWLSSAFGFKERARMLGKDGRLSHGEMQAGDGVIMLGTPTPDYQAPRRHREACEPAQKWSAVPYIVDGVLVYVEDVDAHFRAGEATRCRHPRRLRNGCVRERYRAEDLEGHRWMFMQRA